MSFISLQSAMQVAGGLAPALQRVAWQGTIALGIVWIVCRFWRNLPARVKCWLWRIAYLKLLLALLWRGPIALPVLKPAVVAPLPTARVVEPGSVPMPVVDVVAAANVPVRMETKSEAPIVTPKIVFSDVLPLIVCSAWVISSLVLLGRILAQWIAAVRFRLACRENRDQELDESCGELAAEMGLRRAPPILISENTGGPLLLGVSRPAIVLPGMMEELPENSVRLILAHELAHLVRRDLAWNLFCSFVESICFFHPLVWIARRESRLSQEIACDELARQAGSASPREYGQMLLAAVVCQSRPAPLLAAGVIESKKTLERRLTAMRNTSIWSGRRVALAGMFLGVLGLVILPSWKLVARDARGQDAAATQPDNAAAISREELSDNQRAQYEARLAMLQAEEDEVKAKLEATQKNADEVKLRAAEVDKAARDQAAADENVVQQLRIKRERELQAAKGQTVIISALIDGTIETLNMPKDGHTIKKDDVICVLDDRRAKLAVDEAKIKLDFAEKELARYKSLSATALVSQEEMEKQQYAVELAQIELKWKQLDLSDTVIVAPASGEFMTDQNALQAGAQVTAGKPLAWIVISPTTAP